LAFSSVLALGTTTWVYPPVVCPFHPLAVLTSFNINLINLAGKINNYKTFKSGQDI